VQKDFIPTKYGQIFVCKNEFSLDKETVLFIHGYPDDHRSWEYQLPFFSTDYNLFAINLPGVGKSYTPPSQSDYHVDVLHEVIVELIDNIGEGKKVHLVGHDWGALLSWGVVSNKTYANRVQSYTSISGPHPAIARQNLFQKLFSKAPHQVEEALDQLTRSWYIFFFQLPILPELLWNFFPKQALHKILQKSDLPLYDPMYSHSSAEIQSKVVKPLGLYREFVLGRPSLVPAKVFAPCQVIIPHDDSMIAPSIYDNLLEYVPNAITRRLHGNHWVHREKPQEINEYLKTFFNENRQD
jgi:pimeloyl-ACP methyl ester carboxylesterase